MFFRHLPFYGMWKLTFELFLLGRVMLKNIQYAYHRSMEVLLFLNMNTNDEMWYSSFREETQIVSSSCVCCSSTKQTILHLFARQVCSNYTRNIMWAYKEASTRPTPAHTCICVKQVLRMRHLIEQVAVFVISRDRTATTMFLSLEIKKQHMCLSLEIKTNQLLVFLSR